MMTMIEFYSSNTFFPQKSGFLTKMVEIMITQVELRNSEILSGTNQYNLLSKVLGLNIFIYMTNPLQDKHIQSLISPAK